MAKIKSVVKTRSLLRFYSTTYSTLVLSHSWFFSRCYMFWKRWLWWWKGGSRGD